MHESVVRAMKIPIPVESSRTGGEDVLKITTLVENSAGEHHALRNEHGISFCVEKDGHMVLFDTGQSDALLHNAAQMGIDLSELEMVVISHGHYDHSGGFRHVAGFAGLFQLRIGRGFFREKYACRKGAYDFLGNNFDESFLRREGIPYSFVTGPIEEIFPGLFLLSGFPRIHDDERINPRFLLRGEDGFEEDRFDDEVLLSVETSRGLVVLLGCSHPGMRNMLDAVKKRLGQSIYAVLGGTHLVESLGTSLECSLEYFNDSGIKIVGVSHCTGKEAMARLKERHTGFFHNVTGSSLFIE